jgi:hypothetical protein
MKKTETTSKNTQIDFDALEQYWADEITLENQMRGAAPITYPSYELV